VEFTEGKFRGEIIKTTSKKKTLLAPNKMNNSNPFVPQGSLLNQQNKRRSRMKLGVFCVLALSVTGLLAMLIQGCKREQPADTTDNTLLADTNTVATDTNTPSYEASNPPVVVPPMASNPPPPVAVPPPVVETAGAEYVVVKGDTLGKIAKKNSVSLKALEAANPGVVPTKLKVGQKLSLPAGGAVAPAAASTTMTDAVATDAGGETYSVKSGDTLTKIAKAHGTTVKAIESANNLTTTKIKVGQKLKIPAKTEAVTSAPAVETAPAPPVPAPSVAPVTSTN
jgi:LysM repeat protein